MDLKKNEQEQKLKIAPEQEKQQPLTTLWLLTLWMTNVAQQKSKLVVFTSILQLHSKHCECLNVWRRHSRTKNNNVTGHMCGRAEASLCQRVCGMMIDDKHEDKSSNHPARELEAQRLLLLTSGTFVCVRVCGFANRYNLCASLINTPSPNYQSKCCMPHVSVCVCMCVLVRVWVWPLDRGMPPATTAWVSVCKAFVHELPSMCDILN